MKAECVEKFQELKLKHNYKYIVFGFKDSFTEVDVLKTAEDADYEVFLAEFPETECRWAVYDFDYELDGGAGKRSKLVFYSWCVSVLSTLASASQFISSIRTPDDAKIKQKMLFASSKDALRRSLVGIAAEVQGTEFSEIAHEIGEYPCASVSFPALNHNFQSWRRSSAVLINRIISRSSVSILSLVHSVYSPFRTLSS